MNKAFMVSQRMWNLLKAVIHRRDRRGAQRKIKGLVNNYLEHSASSAVEKI